MAKCKRGVDLGGRGAHSGLCTGYLRSGRRPPRPRPKPATRHCRPPTGRRRRPGPGRPPTGRRRPRPARVVADHDYDRLHPGGEQGLHSPLDQAQAAQPQQRLGTTSRDGSDPLGPARGQHHTHPRHARRPRRQLRSLSHTPSPRGGIRATPQGSPVTPGQARKDGLLAALLESIPRAHAQSQGHCDAPRYVSRCGGPIGPRTNF
jgi:hypothetical protein